MVKLIADLAQARDNADRAIALGAAVPRLERLKSMVLWGLVAAVVILSVSYIHLTGEVRESHDHQAEIKRQISDAEARVTKLILGKSGASTPSAP